MVGASNESGGENLVPRRAFLNADLEGLTFMRDATCGGVLEGNNSAADFSSPGKGGLSP